MKRTRSAITILSCILGLLLTTGFALAGTIMWEDGSGGDIFWDSGNVGIGTTSPGARLQIGDTSANSSNKIIFGKTSTTTESNLPYIQHLANSNGAGNDLALIARSSSGRLRFQTLSADRMIIDQNGNVGIGITSPGARLQIGDTTANSSNKIIFGKTSTTTESNLPCIQHLANSNGAGNDLALIARSSSGRLRFQTLSADRMIIDQNGNVGIGTTTPDNKLDIKGTICAEEVKVETGWSDFVFEANYNLASLDHVESYIKENKHLPDIPPAKEVTEKGLSVANMMAKQMQKIEELTLYVIEQNKEIKELKKKLTELEGNR